MRLPTRFGCFTSPLHLPGTDPYLLLREDMELVERLDGLGFDEFWVGEHHSGGWASLSSPELFIAAVARHTRQIRLATGVLSVPYHNPFLAAERAAMLDHLTDGRFILGVGSGAYQADMHMLGIDPATTRTRLAEAVEVICRLLRGEEVTATTDWYSLHDARLQLRPFRDPVEVVVASAATPFGMRLAGRLGINAMSHVAPPWGAVRAGQSIGAERLPSQWEHLVEAADHPVDRSDWRLVVPVHVSDSVEQAKAELLEGWRHQRTDLYNRTLGVPIPSSEVAQDKAFDYTVAEGGLIIGSPEDCVRAITELAGRVGGFGCLLISYQDWAPAEARARSLELFARQVAPRLRGTLDGIDVSRQWVGARREQFVAANASGRDTAMRPEQETATVGS
ncbi:LLM class flavin-dependent oxidoreductase [Actinophytocola algeriensis]|uniref:Limonene 1,2-monooxygenase n=1 Tax=Actinophytocola algeriensis TaxID=1768010 RepID=A0A7W7QC05_9PSEU|nr:LLM class flavin-dependent oxidoreductase [Actinophytocola algeriensis]MBB4910643.1 limonene 1,2-monooxygenase [Actinophytocola algeriensis]MBE1473636.1 limonene 1,2-monooxygenase [Actinophytocola algeriensis]